MSQQSPVTPLISAPQLAERMSGAGEADSTAPTAGARRTVVLDATVIVVTEPVEGYVTGDEQFLLSGHIPGALFADLLEEFSDSSAPHIFTRPSAAQFERAAGALGIDGETSVVVYDTGMGQWAARLWWLFRSFGHQDVSVLDGGLSAWTSAGHPLEVGYTQPDVRAFAAAPQPGFWAEKAEVEAIVAGNAQGALLCAAPSRKFSGEEPVRGRRGHIPGSSSVPLGRLVDRETKALLGPEELRVRLRAPLASDRVITYCTGGIASASGALALHLLGHQNVSVYDGSLSEWSGDPSAPLSTPAPIAAGAAV